MTSLAPSAPPELPKVQTKAGPAPPSRPRLLNAVRVLGLLLAAFLVFSNVQGFQLFSNGFSGYDPTPLLFEDQAQGEGFLVLHDLPRGATLEAAGLRPGDAVRFDDPSVLMRPWPAGERLGVTVRRGDRVRHLGLTARPGPPGAVDLVTRAAETGRQIAYLVSIGLGSFVLIRARRGLSALLLGLALIGNSFPGPFAPVLPLPPASLPTVSFLYYIGDFCYPLEFLAFGLVFSRDHGLAVARWEGWAVAAFAALYLVLIGELAWIHCFGGPAFLSAASQQVVIELIPLSATLLGALYLCRGWLHGAREERARYLLLFMGALLFVLSMSLDPLSFWLSGGYTLGVLVEGPAVLLAVIVLTVAILRHRVYNLGFAINRTVVYALVSVLMLATFGLVEWSADHFLPLEGREKNVILDAAVALSLYLAFHTLHRRIEQAVERIFFRSWRRAEGRFRRFLRDAAFISAPEILLARYAEELAAFTEGAETALYLVEETRIRRAAGALAQLPEHLDPDLPALVRLRADLQSLLGEDGLEGGAWFPMVLAHSLTGAVVIGPRPDGALLRPLERELLARSAVEIALHLQTLKLAGLEARSRELLIEARSLRQVIREGLASGLPKPPDLVSPAA